jgi:hypothetical protein
MEESLGCCFDSSTSDDSDDGSLPELLDGSDCDERDQDLEDRQLGLNASGLITIRRIL